MGEWPRIALGDIAATRDGAIAIGPFGSAMKADNYTPSGVPVIRGTNISSGRAWKGDWVFISDEFASAMPRCVVRTGDLVFPHRGSIGEVAIIPEGEFSRYFLSTSLMKVTLDTTKAVPQFVYYFFKSIEGRNEILKYASQVGTPGIGQPLSSLRKFMLPHPPVTDQSRIAAVLAALDDKIDLNRRMNETLETMAQAIFKDWFVDFSPTRAKMEGRSRT
jgi:type I restriction enzyme S subunit